MHTLEPPRSTDGVCPCTCDYVADASCTCRDLAGAVNVTLAKSAVYASYPLQYVQTFNYKPYEVRPAPSLPVKQRVSLAAPSPRLLFCVAKAIHLLLQQVGDQQQHTILVVVGGKDLKRDAGYHQRHFSSL